MIQLMKYTYLLDVDNIEKELENLWCRYQKLIDSSDWDDVNEARAILYLVGQVFCEQIAPGAIERRLHLLKEKLNLIEFFTLVDQDSEKLKELRKDELFEKLEKFYCIVKKYKNKYVGGKYYLDEEKFIENYNEKNPDKSKKIGYRGSF